MAVDRSIWRFQVSEDHVPDWPCPHCGTASLAVSKKSFNTVMDRPTKLHWGEPDFDPEWEKGRFVCLLVCTKTSCGETCAVAGNYDITINHDENGAYTYTTGTPSSIVPPPPLIKIPKGCPAPVRAEIVAAFSLYWCDLGSSLNRIRSAIELLLTELGVKRYGRNSKTGKRVKLMPDTRIQILRSKKPALADLCDRLLAVKYLGNAGSHPGETKHDDVFDGFDILERVLHDIYSDHDSVLAKMVRQIIRKKGPRKR